MQAHLVAAVSRVEEKRKRLIESMKWHGVVFHEDEKDKVSGQRYDIVTWQY